MITRLSVMTILALTAFTSHGQSIKIHSEKGVDLTDYETFTVMKGEFMTSPDSKKISEQALFQSVKTAVRREMEDRGYKFVDDSTAQLWIGYVAGSYNLTNAGVNGPLGQTPASNAADMNQSRNWSHTSQDGMLVLDISDSANKKPLWKAECEDLSLDSGDFKRVLDAAIFKAYRKFPNKLKKKKK